MVKEDGQKELDSGRDRERQKLAGKRERQKIFIETERDRDSKIYREIESVRDRLRQRLRTAKLKLYSIHTQRHKYRGT